MSQRRSVYQVIRLRSREYDILSLRHIRRFREGLVLDFNYCVICAKCLFN